MALTSNRAARDWLSSQRRLAGTRFAQELSPIAPQESAMAARSIASLTLGFGLVSIPVRLFSATESSVNISFKLLAKDGSRLKQQYISDKTKKVVTREEMTKGFEFEPDHFVLFTAEELKKLEEGSSHVIEIVAFVPIASIDPLYYDKPYLLAPDKRGGKPYALLAEAMRKSGRCAIAKWAWKAKQYMVQVRAVDDGLVLQQLLYANEVRSLKDLAIEPQPVPASEMQLALQLINQIAEDSYDPSQYEDEERKRVLEAIDRKIEGKEIVMSAHGETEPGGGRVIDLMDALRASLVKKPAAAPKAAAKSNVTPIKEMAARKGVKRAAVAEPAPAPAAAPRARAKR
jgi:DNA end-binding protein Ku